MFRQESVGRVECGPFSILSVTTFYCIYHGSVFKIALQIAASCNMALNSSVFPGVLFNIAQSLPSHVVFEMFQAIGNIFGKVLSFDICQCVQALKEKLSNSKESEMMGNGQLENGKVHDEKDKVDVDQEVGTE